MNEKGTNGALKETDAKTRPICRWKYGNIVTPRLLLSTMTCPLKGEQGSKPHLPLKHVDRQLFTCSSFIWVHR